MHISRSIVSGILVGMVVAGASMTSAVAAPADRPGQIGDIFGQRASHPTSRGGFEVPWVAPCSDTDLAGPKVTVTVRNGTGLVVATTTVADGSLPGIAEIRLRPGVYRVTSTSFCPDRTKNRTQQVRIGVKTDRSTISAAEYRKIKKGMTKARVRRIVGTYGDVWQRTSIIERTTYRDFAMIQWNKKGRVAHKYWAAPID